MGWLIVANIFSALMALLSIRRLSDQEKDLEILILRQQLSILQRKQQKSIKPNRAEKMLLSVLAVRLKQVSNRSITQLRSVIRLFQPHTVLAWHQQLVRRKWTYKRKTMAVDLPSTKRLKA